MARPPSAASVLTKAKERAARFPARSFTWEVLDERGVAKGAMTLSQEAGLEIQHPGLSSARGLLLWGELLVRPSRAALERAGIDTRMTVLYHHQQRIVVVVGSDDPRKGKPQVWFERETGAVVMVSLGGLAVSSGRFEAPGTEGQVPARVRLSRKDHRWLCELAPPGR